MTALHGNKRKDEMFTPYGGRFAEPTKENINLCKAGKLEVDVPELDLSCIRPQYCDPVVEEHLYSDVSSARVHPVTHTANRYCAVDRFHKDNIKTDTEKLRNIDLVKQLKGSINTQVMEQMFEKLGKDRYFVNMLKPTNYLFVMRLLLHLHNDSITNRQVARATQAFSKFQTGAVASIGSDSRLYMTLGNKTEDHFAMYIKQCKSNELKLHVQVMQVYFGREQNKTELVNFMLKQCLN